MTVEAFAPAKINLTLHVTGQRVDGYHLLDSLVMFADFGDRLWLTPGAQMGLEITGPFALGVPTDASNLVWRAARSARWCGQIRLEKNLPHGAGIGGGSSDAAAILRALKTDDTDQALALGADIPVCMAGHSARMQGIGEQVTALQGWPSLNAVLVNPGVAVPTPQVFKALKAKTHPAMPATIPQLTTAADIAAWLATQRNDLQTPAQLQQPVISGVLATLSNQQGALIARMSGSGATCFALFDTAAAAAASAQNLKSAHPEWWTQACTLS